MPGEDQSVGVQFLYFRQAALHVLRVASWEIGASDRPFEYQVSCDQHFLLLQQEADMAGGMAGRLHHLDRQFSDLDNVAFRYVNVDRRRHGAAHSEHGPLRRGGEEDRPVLFAGVDERRGQQVLRSPEAGDVVAVAVSLEDGGDGGGQEEPAGGGGVAAVYEGGSGRALASQEVLVHRERGHGERMDG